MPFNPFTKKKKKRRSSPFNVKPQNNVSPFNVKPQNKTSPFNTKPQNDVSPFSVSGPQSKKKSPFDVRGPQSTLPNQSKVDDKKKKFVQSNGLSGSMFSRPDRQSRPGQGSQQTQPSGTQSAQTQPQPQNQQVDLTGLTGLSRQLAKEKAAGIDSRSIHAPDGVKEFINNIDTEKLKNMEPPKTKASDLFGEMKPDAAGPRPKTKDTDDQATMTSDATTGQQMQQATTGRAAPEQDQLTTLQNQLMDTMTPTEEEKRLQQKIAQLQGAAQLDMSEQEGQGRGITSRLVRGKQEQIQEQANLKLQTLGNQLQNLQAQRKARQNALSKRLEFAQAEQQAEAERQAALMEQMKPFEFGNQLVQFNPQTGQLETLAQQQASQDPVTLSAGESLVDPTTGEVIAGMPEEQEPLTISPGETIIDPETGSVLFQAQNEPEDVPTSIQEYLFAKQQGYTGTFQDYQNQSSGDDTMSQETARAVFLSDQANDAIDTLMDKLEQNKAPGSTPLIKSPEYKKAEDLLITYIGFLSSGANVPESEVKRFQRLLPSRFKGPKQAKEDLEQLQRNVESLKTRIVGKQGDDPLDLGFNSGGNTDDPIDLGFNSDLSTSQKGSGKSVLDLGPITAYGSPKWDKGLDIDLQKGDPVPSPVTGQITYVGPRGGFGNQVRVVDAQGREHWLSHLDRADVQVGQNVFKGQNIGAGGNTGDVIPMGGGDGSHLDYTVVDASGNFIPPEQIEQMIDTEFV